jgi:hypothetical protein
MSGEVKAGRSKNIKNINIYFEREEMFKYLGTNIKIQNSI